MCDPALDAAYCQDNHGYAPWQEPAGYIPIVSQDPETGEWVTVGHNDGGDNGRKAIYSFVPRPWYVRLWRYLREED